MLTRDAIRCPSCGARVTLPLWPLCARDLQCRSCAQPIELDPATPWAAFVLYTFLGHSVLFGLGSLAKWAELEWHWYLLTAAASWVYPISMRFMLVRLAQFRCAAQPHRPMSPVARVADAGVLVTSSVTVAAWLISLRALPAAERIAECSGWLNLACLVVSVGAWFTTRRRRGLESDATA